MVVEIDVTYHLNIDIVDVTNVVQNTLKASSERITIDFPPHHLSWFKLSLPAICIKPSHSGRYFM